MKNKLIIACLLSGIVSLTACKKFTDFGDTNISPNGSLVPLTKALLTNAEYGLSTFTSREFQTNPTLFVQWLMQTQYPDEAQYGIPQVAWTTFYVGFTDNSITYTPLTDLQKIIDYAGDPANATNVALNGSPVNQVQIARILKAYTFGIVTDLWGDVPYSEALKGNMTPKYDKQEDIYKDMIAQLKDAVSKFDNSGALVQGDIIFGTGTAANQIASWKRFANSLRMIYSLRMSKRYPGPTEYAATEFKSALNDAGGYIATNAQNAAFQYQTSAAFRSPWWKQFNGRADYAPASTFVDTLNSFNDPRRAVYFTTATGGGYKGIPYGLKRDLLLQWETANPGWSLMGTALTSQTAPGYIITAAQMAFTRAEAAFRGWTTENAQSLYEQGIQLSWQQWGVYDATAYAAYIADPKTAYTPDPLRKIATQKWIALYPTQYFEAYAEWRRLGYPVLVPSAYAVNQSRQIPRRYRYPANEATLNAANYEAAVAALPGGDLESSRVWWDR